jgi:type IV pilus assembly protein PilW
MKTVKSKPTVVTLRRQSGLTLIELLVALAIGSFLIIGSVQIYNQSRQAFVINESIARVQETAQFAMDTIEADLRMASNWGSTSRALAVEGRSLGAAANPTSLPAPANVNCGDDWAFNIAMTVDGDNNGYTLGCAAQGTAQANSDTVTVRRATVQPQPLEAGRLQVQATRVQGRLFADGNVPVGFDPAQSTTHNLLVNTYYVADNSTLIPGVPTLRRKTLTVDSGAPFVDDQEVAPGVENLQIQFGVDLDGDNTVDTYVNPGAEVYNPTAGGFVAGARIITARVWLVVRGISAETGIQHVQNYQPGDVTLGVPTDAFRRLQVSKTILLRNART